MKKTLFISIIAAIAVCGCAREDIPSGEKQGLTLTFSLPDFERTKAPEDGVESLNENLINSCYYFLFKDGDSTGEPAVKGFAAGLSAQGSYEETIPVSANTVNNVLFKDSRSCHVFVVVNPTPGLEAYLKGTGSHSLQNLRTATVASTLDGKQKNFVMVHDGKVNVTSRADDTAMTAELELTRLACKFTFHVKVAAEVNDNGVIWIPVTNASGLNVTVSNLLGKSTLSGFDETKVSNEDYFETSPVAFTYEKDVDEQVFKSDGTPLLDDDHNEVYKTFKKFNSNADSPVYSYPMAWEFTDKHEPYLMFEQTWNKKETSTYESRYYKLVLGQKSITANDWYDITVKLDVLGSFERKDPTVMFSYMDYLVKGWNNAFSNADEPNTPADIKDMRYLMTYGNSYMMDNINTITIPFTSSHPCVVEVVSAKYDNFEGNTVARGNKTLNDAKYSLSVNATNDGIILTHNLVNTMDETSLTANEDNVGSFDYCQYTFTIKLYQEGKKTTDESEYCKIITVKQNPALVLDAILNDKDGTSGTGMGYTQISTSPSTRLRDEMYTVFVNGNNYYHNNSSDRNYMEVYGKNSNSGNPNLYSISVSKSDDYIIGDPRRTTPWTTAELTFSNPATTVDKNPVSAPHFDGQTGGNRTLKYYYPTYEDNDHANMIAPKYLIVSGNSFCNSYQLNKQRARQRCATYQEYGYPAGRWRIPTLAELQFVATLMAYGKMPTSFADGGNYWTATGVYTFSTSSKSFTPNSSATTAVLRCVYDEWYWENSEYSTLSHNTSDTPNYTQFVWGDMARENFK